MRYTSYLNMGYAYDNECNYFNAILAYEYSISREKIKNLALNNLTCSLLEIGLQFEALKKINKCISNFERGKGDGNESWMYYNNRGLLLGWFGKEDAMRIDLNKSLNYKLNGATYRHLAILEMKEGNIENAANLFDKAIENCESRKFCGLLIMRGEFYYILKDYSSALLDLQKALELSKSSILSEKATYFLGKINHAMGDVQRANEFYFSLCKMVFLSERYLGKFDFLDDINGFFNVVKSKHEDVFSESYPNYKNELQVGIVLSIDESKGFGFILGRSFFNPYDSMYFRVSDTESKIKQGDRVKFQIGYHKRNGKYSAKIVKLQKDDCISDLRYRVHNVYHAVIVSKQCAFRSNKTKYVEIFYPLRTFIAYDKIADNLNSRLIEQLTKRGFAFIEIDMVVLDSGEVEFNSIKEISIENSFSNKYVQVRYDQFERKTSNWRGVRSKWSCFVCDGDEDTGCLMSDPQNCPNGRGI